MSTRIYSGGQITKDPDSQRVLSFLWGEEELPSGVTILTSTYAVTGPDALLTVDNTTISGRTTTFRLLGGTLGKKYRVTNTITTDETPSQKDDASFTVLIANK